MRPGHCGPNCHFWKETGKSNIIVLAKQDVTSLKLSQFYDRK